VSGSAVGNDARVDSDSDGGEYVLGEGEEELDYEVLRSFGRVVPIAPPRNGGTDVDLDDEGEEDDGAVEQGSDVSYDEGETVATTTANKDSRPSKPRRAPKQPGMGRYGRLKKGSRSADPYGTEAVANAAMRRTDHMERAAVALGPAASTALGSADAHVHDEAEFIPSSERNATRSAASVRDKNRGNKSKSSGMSSAAGVSMRDNVPRSVRGK
jgi:hypothetical protein